MWDGLDQTHTAPADGGTVHPQVAPDGRSRPVALFVGPQDGACRAEAVARDGGLVVVRVGDAASAEAALSQQSVNLVVLVGGPDGRIDFSACHRLSSLRAAPVLVVAAAEHELDRVLALELGADDCVAQGCWDRELIARMRALTRRAARPTLASAAATLRFRDFRLDLSKRELRRLDGSRLRLSRSEFDLLDLFVGAPSRLLSSEEIAKAFAAGETLNPRAVAVRVYRLRRRLRDGSGPDLIRTVHGMGYVFEAAVRPE